MIHRRARRGRKGVKDIFSYRGRENTEFRKDYNMIKLRILLMAAATS